MALTGPYYWDGTHYPTQDGKPVLITQAQFNACCCVEAGEDCEHCPDVTPLKYTVVLSGTVDCGCVIETGDGASAEATYSIDATFCLTQDGVDPCLWTNPNVGTVAGLYEYWSAEDCTGDAAGPWSGTLRAELIRTAGNFELLIYAEVDFDGSSGLAWALWGNVNEVNCNTNFIVTDTGSQIGCYFNHLSNSRWKLVRDIIASITPGCP